MNKYTIAKLDSLVGAQRRHAIRDLLMIGAVKRVALAQGIGSAMQWSRDRKAKARAKGRIARASRKANRR